MSTLTSRVVTRVSALPSTGATFVRTGIDYDYAIGGLPFMSGASTQRPLERQTADYRKQQIDQSAEAGEQTLAFWWTRSQSSFHAGTGILYEEPDQNFPNNTYRFQDSSGVDPWTAGKVTLLPATKLNLAATNPLLIHGCVDSAGPTDMYLQAETTTLKRVLDGSSSTITWGGTGTILSLCDDGTNYYAADSTGIYKGTLAGGVGAKIWNTGNANVRLGWTKQRLMAGIGPSLYELSSLGTGGPVLPATAKFTHPNPGWQWTSITETPSAILAAGYVGAQSAIFKLVLDTSGVVPMTTATSSATLPSGEIVYSIYDYLGNYVAIGTSAGVRIASVDDSSGNLQYGPLTITSAQPVRSLVGRDRFVYAACSNQLAGNSGLWCIDLSTQVQFRKFAYAPHLQTHVAGTVQRVGLFGSSARLVIAVDSHGSYLEDTAHLEPTGYLLTGRIRYHTLEPKLYKYVRPRIAASLAGSLSVGVVHPDNTEITVASYTTAGLSVLEEASFGTNLGPQEFVAMRFTLNRDDVSTNTGPTFSGYQVKSLPAAKRQRNFVLPLMCFDYEKDRHGSTVGGEGTAVTRLEQLEALEEAGDLVLTQDLTRIPMRTHLAVIDNVRFVQDTPPAIASGWGGYVFVTLRTVT